jgi:outer membrane protein OmpA-like peptidoglycan-associated protein
MVMAQSETLVVYFESGKNVLSAAQKALVEQAVASWSNSVIEKIVIDGFCDDTGSETLNFELSERRAQALYEELAQLGVDVRLLKKITGRGSLAVENQSDHIDEQRRQNRRAIAYVWYAAKEDLVYLEPTASISKKGLDVKLHARPLIMGTSIATGDRFTLDKVLFVGSRSIILASSYGYLKQFIDELNNRPDVRIRIEGHVCCTKPGQDGMDIDTKKRNLSYSRAKAVYEYLVEHGINPARMEYVGLKGDFPLGGDPALDRRVEIEILEVAQ